MQELKMQHQQGLQKAATATQGGTPAVESKESTRANEGEVGGSFSPIDSLHIRRQLLIENALPDIRQITDEKN